MCYPVHSQRAHSFLGGVCGMGHTVTKYTDIQTRHFKIKCYQLLSKLLRWICKNRPRVWDLQQCPLCWLCTRSIGRVWPSMLECKCFRGMLLLASLFAVSEQRNLTLHDWILDWDCSSWKKKSVENTFFPMLTCCLWFLTQLREKINVLVS